MGEISGIKFQYNPIFWEQNWQVPLREACSPANSPTTEKKLNALHNRKNMPYYPYCYYFNRDIKRRPGIENPNHKETHEDGIATATDLSNNTKGSELDGYFVAQQYWIPQKYIQMAFDAMPQELVDILNEAKQTGRLEEVSENIARLMCILFSFIFDESKFDSDEKIGEAIGLCQIKHSTAKSIYFQITSRNDLTPEDLKTPEMNMLIGFQLIFNYIKAFNSTGEEGLTAEKFANINLADSLGLVTASFMIGDSKVSKNPKKYKELGPSGKRRSANAEAYFQFQSADLIQTIQNAFSSPIENKGYSVSTPLVSIVQ